MKIYILTGGIYYEGETVLGVFDTKEKAEEAESKHRKKEKGGFTYDEYYIEELDLNELQKR